MGVKGTQCNAAAHSRTHATHLAEAQVYSKAVTCEMSRAAALIGDFIGGSALSRGLAARSVRRLYPRSWVRCAWWSGWQRCESSERRAARQRSDGQLRESNFSPSCNPCSAPRTHSFSDVLCEVPASSCTHEPRCRACGSAGFKQCSGVRGPKRVWLTLLSASIHAWTGVAT